MGPALQKSQVQGDIALLPTVKFYFVDLPGQVGAAYYQKNDPYPFLKVFDMHPN